MKCNLFVLVYVLNIELINFQLIILLITFLAWDISFEKDMFLFLNFGKNMYSVLHFERYTRTLSIFNFKNLQDISTWLLHV